MKTVYFIRHGKSSWENSSLRDEERPLKTRGEKDAKLMADILKKRGIVPGHVLSSPALRALETARIFSRKLDFAVEKIEVVRLLYFEGIESIMKAIRQLDDRQATIFIFGHNPDFTEIANRFSSKSIDNLPTCGVAGVDFKAKNWKDASYESGRLIILEYPSLYR